MGANQSVGVQKIKLRIQHPRFANTKLCTQNSKQILLTEIQIEEKKYNQWKKQLQSYSLNEQYLLLPLKSQYTKQMLCSQSGTAKIFYPKFPYLLKNEIYDRSGKKQFFTEQQLWFLLFSIISAKKQFIHNKINQGNAGDIRPQNIFLSEKAQIKIANYLSFPGQQNKEHKLIGEQNKLYLGPQNLVHLSLGMSYTKTTHQTQMFAIGLTMLGCSILKNNSELYNFESHKFNFSQLMNRIQCLKYKTKYSQLLIIVIELLCSVQVEKRLSYYELSEILFRYENPIKTKKNFTPYPIPTKIQNKIRQNRINSLRIVNISPDQSSLTLTQAIMGNYDSMKGNRGQKQNSLFDSINQSNLKSQKIMIQGKPLQRYQQINANSSLNNIFTDQQSFAFSQSAKQISIKPIIVDKHRPSNDIDQEISPSQSLTHSSIKGISRTNHIIQTIKSQTPINFILQQRQNFIKSGLTKLGKKTNQSSKLKIRQSRSYDPIFDNLSKQQIVKTQNSTITHYIAMPNEFDRQSSKNSFPISGKLKSKQYNDKSTQKIVEISKQGSQIQIGDLSPENKLKIQDAFKNKKQVKFVQSDILLDTSQQSYYLQIENINIDLLNEIGPNKLLIEYKHLGDNSIIVQSIKLSTKNSVDHSDNFQQKQSNSLFI